MEAPKLSGPKLNQPAPGLRPGRSGPDRCARSRAQAIAALRHRSARCLSNGAPACNTDTRYIGSIHRSAALLELAILGLLKEQDLHGYELKKRLTDTLGSFSSVSFGSLYPALNRLERAGAVAATATPESSAALVPMTGSLAGELAAYRARGRQPRQGGR